MGGGRKNRPQWEQRIHHLLSTMGVCWEKEKVQSISEGEGSGISFCREAPFFRLPNQTEERRRGSPSTYKKKKREQGETTLTHI